MTDTSPMAPASGGPFAAVPSGAGPIALVDPQTRALVGLDDPSQLPSLLELGYRPASPEEVQAHELRKQYDTFSQTAAAAGEGAIDTLLPVVGPALERALGVTPESMQARAAFHPVARVAGQVGAGLAGAALGVGAPGLIAKVGGGVAARVGGGVLGAAVGEAAQGLLYSASDVANRAVMEDPALTAESALREVGIATAISGGLGALGGLAKRFAQDHAEQWSRDLQDAAADRVGKVYGMKQGERNNLVAKYGEEGYLARMREMAQDPLLRPGPFDNSASMWEKSQKAADEAWTAMKVELDAAGSAGATINGEELLQKFRAVVAESDSNPFVPKSAISRLDDMLEKYERQFAGKEIPAEGVWTLRKQLSSVMRMSGPNGPRVLDFDGNIALGAMHDWRDVMSDSIEAALDKASVGSDAWKVANRRFHLAKIGEYLAQRGISRDVGNNPLSLTELLTGGIAALAGGEPVGTAHAIGRGLVGSGAAALLRRQGSNALFWIGDRASKVLENLHKGIEDEVGKAVERAFSGAGGIGAVKASELFTPENFSERASAINRHLATPQQFALSDPTLDSFAAPVMEQVRARVLAAVQALGGRIPKYDVAGPLDPEYRPSLTDINKLNRYAEVAHDPLSVLAHVSAGTILPEHVQALDTVWPEHGAIIRMKTLERLTTGMAKGEVVPPRVRYGLALLLGQDLGRATTGAAIAAAQGAYAARTPSPQGAPPPPGSRAEGRRVRDVETKIGHRAATEVEASAEHLRSA